MARNVYVVEADGHQTRLIEASQSTQALAYAARTTYAVRKASQQASAWSLDGVPALGVNGKYLTSPSMARGNTQVLQVVDQLLELERKARK